MSFLFDLNTSWNTSVIAAQQNQILKIAEKLHPEIIEAIKIEEAKAINKRRESTMMRWAWAAIFGPPLIFAAFAWITTH